MAKTKKIYSIIIPVFIPDKHIEELVLKCLNSLLATTYPEVTEIIVIDNGSIKTDIETLCDIYEKYTEPLGYARAVNLGVKRATGDILIIANQDLEFEQGWLYQLTEPLKEYGICSIRESDYYGETTEDSMEIDGKFGSLWALKKETFERIGNLSEEFGRGYFEDTDYHQRAKGLGITVVKNHRGFVIHREPSSSFIATGIRDETYRKSKEIYENKVISQ